ncbi:alpha/beta-hydrolase [Rozella allomycis CSF55]|uniref:Alpha/beta hydrolase family domain-containing protein n=1 Tax=Rozella allomycis (strain CSF55) TaxID=988480 RepID=A0A075AQW4_ROZAC|nr:Alpha/beta hydrolase family domain-containing protein [Rozella allomycis CSF55]RKP20361.1 alpha/beta-hydrolase [Rozella allomycis CSF55]|eukprot:EPZ32603.1 Alpha/beta hydrolase family domain-containing protein [Rozella allomycis CSF55]
MWSLSTFIRKYSCSSPLKLSISKFPSPKETSKIPFVFVHGLFGSKQNWRSLCLALARQSNVTVYALDLRNHGESPHSEHMDYSLMSQDIKNTVDQMELKTPFNLVGHSLGGKVVMRYATDNPQDVNHLVVVDIEPVSYKNASLPFDDYLDIMAECENANYKKRSLVEDHIAKYIDNLEIRQFLMTNAIQFGDGTWKFRCNVPVLKKELPVLFGYEPGSLDYSGRITVVAGRKSHYVKNLHSFEKYFPNAEMSLIALNTGHWVHAERPQEFLEILSDISDTK